jgi:predicted dehydrogenase
MGQGWAKNLTQHPDVDLSGWVDIRPDAAAAAAVANELTVPFTGDDLARALAEVRPDFLVDVTSPEAHHDVTIAALNAGVPVLGEKPMASTMDEARRMVTASDRSGKLYMVSQSRRYNRQLSAYRELIRNRLGRVGILNADFYIGAHFGGFRDAMPSPLVLDMAIHTFDEARFITGLDPVAVYAEEFNPVWSWYQGDAAATAMFEMENQVRFTYRGSWCAEGCHTSWDADWRTVGEFGTAIWEENDMPFAQIVVNSGGFFSETEEVMAAVEPGREGIEGSLDEFLAALRSGNMPNGECHDNIKSLAMVFAVIASSSAKRRVAISEVL